MATWRQRFALSTYDNRWQEYFCASRCVEDRKAYLAVRVCLFVSVLAVFVWSVAHHPSRCYLIYLTNQMLIIEVVYLAFAAYRLNWKKFDRTALMAAVILLVVCPLVYCGFAACCGRRTRKVENDDLNRRASAMSIELVRRRSSINYDNLPVNRV
jgi:hypothetical protein